MWTVWMLSGCSGGRELLYRPVEGEDEIGQLDLFPEKMAPEVIEGPHATGSSLSFVATRRRDPPTAWTAETMSEAIAQVVAIQPIEAGVRIELRFHRQGATELFLFDGSGTIIDVVHLSVRDPVGVELRSWDDLAAGGGSPVGETLHLVPGTRSSVAVSWLDGTGAPLWGGGLVELDASSATTGAALAHGFDGQLDRVDVVIEETAPSALFPVTFLAPTGSFTRQVEIHDRDEVDRVELVERDFDETTARGTILAEVYAGDERMIGAPVEIATTFENPQSATTVVWEDRGRDVTTTITACFDAVCDTIEVPGEIVEISGSSPEPPACGCAQAGAGASTPRSWWAGAVLGLLLVGRRSRASYSRTMVL